MKTVRVLLILALALALFGLSGAKAQAFTYTSGFQVQNLEATDATVTITFYNQTGGTQAYQATETVTGNGSKTFFPIYPNNLPNGFNGSVVISSDKQVAAIGNVVGNNFAASASYSAATAGSNTVLIPLLMKGNSGFNTWFNVQNTGAADANVTVTYSDGTSATATITPGAAHTFNQYTETHSAKVFSAVVTSDQPVAATVIEESSTIMFAYSGFNAGTTNPLIPLVNTYNAGTITGMQIQNAGTQPTDVTVQYTPAGAGFGTACTESMTIAAGTSSTFALYAFSGAANPNTTATDDCLNTTKLVGSAKVTANSANQPLTVIINQLGAANGSAYNGFAAGTQKVVMPLIMDRNSIYFTGFNVQNVGAAATDVTCTFSGQSYTVTANLAPGAALNDLQQGKIADKYVGSATCTAASGGQIVGVVNELGQTSAADALLTYEGVNTP